MNRHLPTLKLSRLKEKRHQRAIDALSLGLGKILPEGLPDSEHIPENRVECSLAELQAVGLSDVAAKVETIASYCPRGCYEPRASKTSFLSIRQTNAMR